MDPVGVLALGEVVHSLPLDVVLGSLGLVAWVPHLLLDPPLIPTRPLHHPTPWLFPLFPALPSCLGMWQFRSSLKRSVRKLGINLLCSRVSSFPCRRPCHLYRPRRFLFPLWCRLAQVQVWHCCLSTSACCRSVHGWVCSWCGWVHVIVVCTGVWVCQWGARVHVTVASMGILYRH